jgi:hypothetical protein
VEHQREKKFARRLLSDLRQDSIFFEARIKLLQERQEAQVRFLNIMTNGLRASDSAVNRGFVGILLLTKTSNNFITASYNQMKTSGSLRYINNDNLTTSLQKYYDVFLASVSTDFIKSRWAKSALRTRSQPEHFLNSTAGSLAEPLS